METTNINPMPRIGDIAPEFRAVTTHGEINFPHDFKGKWKILFSHPGDFTPVCTSEFITFASMQRDFDILNCQLIGLSVDGVHSHIAWLRTIYEKIDWEGLKNVQVRFPVIADLNMEVARRYGMLQEHESSTATVRAVFFIDPDNVVRTIMYYPLALGRNFREIKRVLIGLQTIDKYNVALPANWFPGDDVIIPAPSSCRTAKERMESSNKDVKCHDWFFCTKPLDRDKVLTTKSGETVEFGCKV